MYVGLCKSFVCRNVTCSVNGEFILFSNRAKFLGFLYYCVITCNPVRAEMSLAFYTDYLNVSLWRMEINMHVVALFV